MKIPLVIALICFSSLAYSNDTTWALTGSGNWNVDANWTSPPFPNDASDIARLENSITSNALIPLGQNISLNQLYIDSAFNYTVSGNTLSFPTVGSLIQVSNLNGNGFHSITSDMTLATSSQLTNDSTSDFTLSGAIAGSISKFGSGAIVLSGNTSNTSSSNNVVSSGTLVLDKTPGVNAIGNSLSILSGATVKLANTNQIINTASVTVIGGTLDLNGFNETIANFNLSSGTLNQVGGTLTVNNTLFMGDGTTISGTVVPGNITKIGTGAQATISGNLNIGAGTHLFSIGNTSNPASIMEISGTLTGTGGIALSATSGQLIFSGSSPNTYTGGTALSGGTLILNKPAGVKALTSTNSVNISGGTLTLQAPGQIVATSQINLASGVFNLGGNDTIGNFSYTGGTFNAGGATLTLAGSISPLTMSNTTISSDLIIPNGTISFSSINNGTAILSGNIDLGNTTHNFSIANGTAATDMLVSGVLTGIGAGITKNGLGLLEFSGSSPNTYTGTTTVQQGTLLLNKGIGVNAIPGSVLINGGTLLWGASNQIADSSIVTETSGTLNLAGFNETIGTFIYNGGTYTPGGGTLSLASAVTALTMRNTTITGNLAVTNGGAITFDLTNNGTAIISGNLDLQTITPNFDIANGTATTDMRVSGIITSSGAGLTKIGAGQLELSGGASNIYTGLTTVTAGTLLLNKTVGFNAIPGDVLINGGTLLWGASDQIPNTSSVTETSGTFNLAGFNETIGTFVFNGGTYNPSGTLSLASASTALSMRDTTIPGNLAITNGGAIVFDATNNGTATLSGNVDLGATTPNFNIANGTAASDMNVSGVLTSSGAGLTKIGAGQLELSGSSPNTYTGLTTVTAGTLLLNKTAGVNAIPGDVLINGGILALGAADQIPNTSTVTETSGTFNLAGFNESIGTFVFNGGSYTASGATLTLASAGTALSIRDTNLTGNIVVSGGGEIAFDATNNGTATISGNVDLGSNSVDFNIADGTSPIDMNVTGVISNGGINKTGPGLLQLLGANTYSNGTTITAGTLQGNSSSLQGNIIDNANLIFEQVSDGTFTGTLSGTGTIEKNGTGLLIFSNNNTLDGLTTVNQGTLSVNGIFGGTGLLQVNAQGRLQGSGTIAKNSLIYGTLAPGNSIGTLHFVGTVTLATGSTLEIEVNPATIDLIDITGNLAIQTGSNLNLLPVAAEYPPDFLYKIVQTTTGVSGTFSSVTSSLPLFMPLVVYTANEVFLKGAFLSFSEIFTKGNAGQVARCLDTMPSPVGSDLHDVIVELQFLTTVADLNDALLQLQPSAFTTLAIAQEDSMLYVKNTIFNRVNPCGCLPQENLNFWITPFYGITKEKNHRQEPEFNANTTGFFAGLDHPLSNEMMIGGGVGYTYSKFDWKMHRGKGKINNLYGSIYGTYEYENAFFQAALIGGYSKYHAKRNINFGNSFFSGESPLIRKAISDHEGLEVSLNTYGSLDYAFSDFIISPFVDVDFLYVYENSFRENGANSLNLHVKSKNSTLLESQLGINFFHCSLFYGQRITETLQVGVIRESRFSGAHEVASFNCDCCTMKVKGWSPSRTLGSVKLGILWDSISCFYNGRYGSKFHDHSVSVEFAF